MANNKERALSILYDALAQGRRYSSTELLSLLERHDLQVSERSLSRWLQALRDEFDLPVKFNQKQKVFEVHENDRPANPPGLLKYTLDSIFLRETLLRNQKAAEVIRPDNRAPALNHHQFRQLVNACLEHRLVQVRHQKFDATEPKDYRLQPFFLKEYLYRWYLIAADTGNEGKIKAFGLERIHEVSLLDERFDAGRRELAEDLFTGLMGITGSENLATEIVLRTNSMQKRFFETLPLHPRQQITQLADDVWEVRFVGKPNLELTQQLVGQLEPIEVVSPNYFRQSVIEFLKRNLAVYAGDAGK
jgi:predicted DNA-binding transcriptional regulator YafY